MYGVLYAYTPEVCLIHLCERFVLILSVRCSLRLIEAQVMPLRQVLTGSQVFLPRSSKLPRRPKAVWVHLPMRKLLPWDSNEGMFTCYLIIDLCFYQLLYSSLQLC